MKRVLIALTTMIVATSHLGAQQVQTPRRPTTATERGNAIDGSFFTPTMLPYSVCNMREFLPTTNVPRGNAVYPKPFRQRPMKAQIEALTFTPTGESEPISWAEGLRRNHVDGIMILHRGRVIYEEYFGHLTPSSPHAVMSVTKSLTGTLAAALVAEGRLDPTKLVSYYLPEMAGSGLGSATVREVMDMTTAIAYSEEYTDPNAEVWAFSAAGNPMIVHTEGAPDGYHAYLKKVKQNGTHGEVFGYRTVNAELLGWIVERVGGGNVAEQMHDRFWSRMGMEQDAYFQVDASGTPFAGGGFDATLRDLARFGQMMLQGGRWQGQQIVPREAVDDIRFGGSAEPFARSEYGHKLPGWSYRNMWWVSNNPDGAYMARGVHGQAIYIDPTAEMVIVRLASNPDASNTLNDYISLPAYQAVADMLKKSKR